MITIADNYIENSIYTLTDGNGVMIADGNVSGEEEEDNVKILEVTRRRLQNEGFRNETNSNSTVANNSTSTENTTVTSNPTARPTLPLITTVSAMGNMTNADSSN